MSRLLCTTLYPNLIWWEDFTPGEEAELGRHAFTEQEIVAFGRQFDPPPFHVDPERARRKGVGLVKHRFEAVNQHGEPVLTMEGWGLFGRKN